MGIGVSIKTVGLDEGGRLIAVKDQRAPTSVLFYNPERVFRFEVVGIEIIERLRVGAVIGFVGPERMHDIVDRNLFLGKAG